ncbi:MAG: nicotinate phosphoribosyltransferase [Pseudomonadota bacterium]|nr:nicotinate phosphoribosyltransferase [Pseudomonadota bacterium]
MTTAEQTAALFTDLYELRMLQAYQRAQMTKTAVFSLYVRDLPATRNFLVAAGVEETIASLVQLKFAPDDLDYLRQLGGFSEEFLGSLADWRFTGSVWGLPEGTPVFANEPLLEVEAPLGQAQIIETHLLNQVGFQTLVASKAVRAVLAAGTKPVIDFGARRAHGSDAAMKAARSAYLVGFQSTSNLLAGRRYQLPVTGTMAHSYIEAHDSELAAFRNYSELYPSTTLLVDTYDSLNGVEQVIALATERGTDFEVSAIRLDSGDLLALSTAARRRLNQAGLTAVQIVASGGLDESAIAQLERQQAPIDAYAMGTRTVTSADAPSLDCAYKLVEYAGRGRMKLSSGKHTLPGRKQVFRHMEHGRCVGDQIGLRDEALKGRRLLVPMMVNGQLVSAGITNLTDARARCAAWITSLPPALLALSPAAQYPVTQSAALENLQAQVRADVESANGHRS